MIYEFDGRVPQIAPDAFVSPDAVVLGDVVIGAGCYVGPGAILRGDYGSIRVGEGSAVEEGVIIHAAPGHTNDIGAHVTMGHGAVLHSAKVGDYAVIGMGAVLSIDCVVGEWAIVAEGAVVKRNGVIGDRVVVAGAPAKEVRALSETDMEHWVMGKQLYVDLAQKCLANPPKRIG